MATVVTPLDTSSSSLFSVGYKGIPISSKSADYGLVLADNGTCIYHPIADDNPRTITIPAEGSINFPLGASITIYNDQNTLSLAITSDVLVWLPTGTTGTRTIAEFGQCTIVKVASARWTVSGVGLT